jgi:lysophospholipase L1-like esterase
MNAHIRSEAVRRGFAYFELGALYDRGDLKPPFSVIAMMTTAAPYGPLISLDGVHPSGAGAAILARAAAAALNATYELGLPE